MTERPILFSGPMVRALLAGAKTQTRRVVKRTSPFHHVEVEVIDGVPVPVVDREPRVDGGNWARLACPYGAPGDTLWVRESFAPRYFDNGAPGYMADWTDVAADVVPEPKWKPSIHMPRALSRISLRVTSVRVERVQDISDADAIAEGVKPMGRSQRLVYGSALENVGPVYPAPAADIMAGGESWTTSAARSFRGLWVSINGAESWESNPWVWCVGFERVESAVLAQVGRAS